MLMCEELVFEIVIFFFIFLYFRNDDVIFILSKLGDGSLMEDVLFFLN